MSKRHFFAILASLAFAVGCSKDPQLLVGSEEEEVEEYFDPAVSAQTTELEEGLYVEPGLHLRPGIEVFDVDPANEGEMTLDDETGTALLQGAAAAQMDGIEVGDIFVSTQTIARVGEVEISDHAVTLHLESFAFWEVVHGEWSLQLPLDREGEDQTYEVDPTDYEIHRQMLSITHDVSSSATVGSVKLSTEYSLGLEANPHMRFEGKIPFYSSEADYHCEDPQVNVNVGCVLGRCAKRYRYCVDYLTLSVEFGADVSGKTTLSATGKEKFETPGKDDKRIYEKTLGQIPLTGPFFLRPALYIERQAYVEASIKGELEVSASAGASVPLGFEYRNGDGFSMIPNERYPATSYANLGGSATLTAKLEAGVWAEAGFEMKVCTPDLPADVCVNGLTAGGRVTVKGAYEDTVGEFVSAPTIRDHCLSVAAEFEAKVTGKAEAEVSAFGFSKKVTLVSVPFSPFKKTLADWDDGGEYCSGQHEILVHRMNEQYNIDIDCELPAENPLAGTCVEAFARPCYQPEGQCSGLVYEDGSYDMVWSSGDRLYSDVTETQTILEGTENEYQVPIGFDHNMFGVDDTHCVAGQSVASSAQIQYDCIYESAFTLLVSDPESDYEEGDVLETCVTGNGLQIFTCPDGTRLTLGVEEPTICLQGGACEFGAGYLENLSQNRGL